MDENDVALAPSAQQQTARPPDRPQRLVRGVLLSLAITPFVLGSLYLGWAAFVRQPAVPLPSPEPPSVVAGETRVGPDAPTVVAEAPAAPTVVPTNTVTDPRWAFLLLGYGGGRHDGAYLTDSIVLAIADPEQKTLTLLSIPRDSWVPLLFDGENAVYSKLNTGYALAKDAGLYRNQLARYTGSQGAGSLAMDTVSRLLGVPIANYLALDFVGFREMIDAVGGIDVDIPESFTVLYPANDDPSIDPGWMTVRFTKGREHMNGERAIEFARAREVISNPSEGSDFARSRRQRLIMEAFKTRLLQPGGLIHLPQLLAVSARHVDTDYAIADVGQLGQFILGWKDVQVYQTALTQGNYLEVSTGPGGAYILVPDAADRTWAQIRAFVRRLWQDPAAGVAMAESRIVIVNATGQPRVGGRLSAVLTRLGYRVAAPQTGAQRAESRLVDRTGGRAKPLVGQLERDLGISFSEVAAAITTNSDDLVLELGMNDAHVADLEVAADDAAPSSAFGIRRFGGWSPEVPTPAPAPQGSPAPQATVLPASTPTASSPVKPQGAAPATATPAQAAAPAPAPASQPPPKSQRKRR